MSASRRRSVHAVSGPDAGRHLSIGGPVRVRYRGGQSCQKIEQHGPLLVCPIAKALAQEPAPGDGESIQHSPTGCRRFQESNTLVALCGVPFEKTQSLELGHLTTDRGMVAADKVREFDDADRMGMPDPGQQGEQRSIQLHAGSRQERLIEIGAVHITMKLQENGVNFV
jgi:hypothetical protein